MSGPQSPTSSPSSPSLHSRPLMERRGSSKSSLSLDLSSLPPLTQPTPPTNTLLITNLNDVDIFRPDNLQTIRELIEATAPVYTWSPLKSFRRIIVSFPDEQAAIKVRSIWDGEAIMGERCRVYFGQHTPLDLSKDNHLNLPDAGKLFFISPPPSPPHGWEMRLEDAPNKLVHAEDLAEALAKLHHGQRSDASAPMAGPDASPVSPTEGIGSVRTRSRSSTLIYEPQAHGDNPNLPAISVDDMTDLPMDVSPTPERPIMAHTTRPPVELME
ncbi:Calcipressin-domain-containing protein [Biscogniauxia mediterranea]|nr:Calcipressin-domain-containing protein [Biscogniauxia mediterranea]